MKFFGLAVATGVLLALSFPRMDWEFLAWGALIPLFFAVFIQTPKRAALLGFTAGMVFYGLSLSWVTNTLVNYGNIPTVIAWPILFLLAGYLSAYMAIFCFLTVQLSRNQPLFFIALAPFLWTALEYLRSTHLEYGFSWQGLGYSQYLNLPVLQMADLTGVYGISFLIVGVNAGLFYLFHPRLRQEAPWRLYRTHVSVAMFGLYALVLAYGWSVMNAHEEKPVKPLKVALVQGNIPQQMKWDPQYKQQILDTYRELTMKAAVSGPDFIVWPEAVTPFYFLNDLEGTTAVVTLADELDTPLLFGSPRAEQQGGKWVSYNSAYLLSGNGNIKGRYDKIHLVPFGEFIPWQSLLFFLDKLVVGIGDFGRGEEATVLSLNGYKFAVSICYEITFPDLVRRPVDNGAQFLVNITNDAWFGKSAASYQHISMAALRAVENRVPIVRAANTGISGAVDRLGRIAPTTELFEREVLIANIQPRTGPATLYSRYGDWFCYLSLLVSVGLGTVAWRRTRSFSTAPQPARPGTPPAP
ncbi:apolipoprotein N-acyltransferase [Nitrospina gracilis]|uniref:apolipoprotein N-acyltransferase n=1 Tax=Nitrospina gracilis TaxID=35801 RepID=UPI001F011E1B|nr:apolipoprotein N-acyltransferase [Nitrospina gracilis]MCF8719185.1 apolipoprotein N-acyltransferase [Nitrospina gracilis Nb-211]